MATKDDTDQGTRIGHLRLLPGSGADTAAKAIGSLRGRQTEFFRSLDEAQRRQPRIITADRGSLPDSAFRPAAAASSAAAAATSGPAATAPATRATRAPRPSSVKIITPSDPASMRETPPGAGRAPAAPAPPAIRGGLTGGGAGPARPGYRSLASGIGAAGERVYDNASVERLQERVAQPGSGLTTQGLTPVANAGGAAPTMQRSLPAIQAQQTQATTVAVPRRLSGDLRGAEDERKRLLGDIDTELFRLGIGGLNSRGKRQLYSDLLGQRAGLTSKRIDQVTGLETQGAQLDASAATESAQLQQQAAVRNADRTFSADQTNLDTQLRQQDLDAANGRVSRTLVDRDGNTSVLTEGGQLRQLTGPDGQPFRQQEDPSLLRAQTVSPDAEFKALSERLAQMQQFGRPQDAAEAKQFDTDVAQLQARMGQLTGTAPAQGGKQVKRTGTLNGRRVVEYTDGTTAYLD